VDRGDREPVDGETAAPQRGEISRRVFFRRAGTTVLVAAAGPAALAACGDETPARSYVGVPSPAINPPPEGIYRFFTAIEARALGVVVDALLPSEGGIPGARDAGVVTFIDHRLAADEGVPTYTDPPFAMTYEGSEPPGPDTDQIIWVPAGELYRYGSQEVQLSSRALYRRGLEALERHALRRFGSSLTDLTPGQAHSVVRDLADGRVPTEPGEPSALALFETLFSDVGQGWLADPMYGGNRNLEVWQAIGYPGAQRAYTPQEMRSGHTARQPQDFAQMHASAPGIVDGAGQLPESGDLAAHIEGPQGEALEFVCRTTPS
jgi:gluconate 2-dehydrogenase gamma chain